MAFSELWEAAQKDSLILVDGGMCRFRKKRDGSITIYEIIVLPKRQGEGIGKSILNKLVAMRPTKIIAKCPEWLTRATRWYKSRGFVIVDSLNGKQGIIHTWCLSVQGGTTNDHN